LLTKSCFASAAHEEIVATETLREVSAIGKEMIGGNRAVVVVATSIVMDSNVFPSRIVKLVRLSPGNRGINWTPWSRLVGGVYSISLSQVTLSRTGPCHERVLADM